MLKLSIIAIVFISVFLISSIGLVYSESLIGWTALKNSGYIAYSIPDSLPTEITAPSLSWYPIFKEMAWFAFGLISAISGLITILEHLKKNKTEKTKITYNNILR